MATQTLFITGTDTGVGKTYVTCLILRHLRARGRDAAGFKPICCGDRDDAAALAEASETDEIGRVNPVWFEAPLAPFAAAKLEGRTLDRRGILDGFGALRATHDWVIVEGAGGWEAPISETETMADLAAEFAAPVLVVAANRLGALNHTLLTCRAIERRGLKCAGVVLNQTEKLDSGDLAAGSNREVLGSVLPEIPVCVVDFQADRPGEELAEILDR